MARLDSKLAKGDWAWDSEEGIESNLQKQHESLNALIKASDNVPDGKLTGIVVKFPIADGHAFYRVSREKPFTLQHIPFGDAYQIPMAHIRGLRKADIVEMRRRDLAVKKLFAAKS